MDGPVTAQNGLDVEPDPHKPLRQDVRLLGELLGETLRAHAGAAVLDTVERVRALAKAARSGDGDFDDLASLLAALPVDAALPLARAFSQFLNLANVAEQHHRIRRRRTVSAAIPESQPQRGSCEETFARLVASGVTPALLHEAVSTLRIELVLTAHPTEVSRRTLIHKYNRIASRLGERDRPDLTRARAGRAVTDALRREITVDLGDGRSPSAEADADRRGAQRPDRVRAEPVARHTGATCVKWIAHCGVPTGCGLPLEAAPVRFGSWMGGDRDGNPNVTPEVTREACLLARWVAVELYLEEVARASRRAVDDQCVTGAARAGPGTRENRIARSCKRAARAPAAHASVDRRGAG